MMSQTARRDGYEALIKPVQDITRLDIDLCQSLAEYLSHILSIGISPVIFAEAALLVQNSTAIYSKKVDALWSTVIQLLDFLSKNNICRQCGGQCIGPCRRRRISRDNGLNNEEGANAEGEVAHVRKKKTIKKLLQTQELQLFKDVCSENTLDIKEKLLEVMKRIVLNATTKVKTDHNTACVIYDNAGIEMGKKDEFRLHWQITNEGLLREDFVNTKNTRKRIEGELDDSCNTITDATFMATDLPNNDDEYQMQEADIFPTPPEITDVPIISECIAESEFEAGAQRMARKENIVSIEDIKKKAWEPVSFDVNMPEKAIRKRNVLKVPEKVKTDNKKRKTSELVLEVDSYLTLGWLIQAHNGTVKMDKELHAHEILTVLRNESALKRQVLQRRRKAYQEIIVAEASKEYEGDFEGFPDMDPDEDDENGGFNGFSDNINNDYVDDNLNVPLPAAVDDFHDREQPNNAYETEALKTLQEYQLSRHKDDQRLSGISERVSAWHQLILPKLEMAESVAHFDIQEYGSRILDKFPTNLRKSEVNIKQFSEIVAGLPKGQVARNFLTTLCLANTGNVEIIKSNPDPLAMDCIQLRLLSRVRHHEEMHNHIKQTNDNS